MLRTGRRDLRIFITLDGDVYIDVELLRCALSVVGVER